MTSAEKAADKKVAEETKPSFQLPLPACLAIGVVMLGLVLQRADFDPSRAPAWGQELFAPHVVPAPAAAKNEVVVQFCQACGTGDLYKQLKEKLKTDASVALTVTPGEYPAAKLMTLLSDFVSMGQASTILALFLRNSALPGVMATNKISMAFAVWLGGSMVGSGLTKTGAFEVYLGDKQVWSSIKEGRTPELKDLVDSFKAVGVDITKKTKQ